MKRYLEPIEIKDRTNQRSEALSLMRKAIAHYGIATVYRDVYIHYPHLMDLFNQAKISA